MSQQKKDKLEQALSKEMLFTPRWNMLNVQRDIEFQKEQIAFWETYLKNPLLTDFCVKIAEDILAIDRNILKNLLKQSEDL